MDKVLFVALSQSTALVVNNDNRPHRDFSPLKNNQELAKRKWTQDSGKAQEKQHIFIKIMLMILRSSTTC